MRKPTIWNAFATIIATMVGVGFISGKEIYTFFQAYGVSGYVGIFIVFILFFVLCQQFLTLKERLQIKDVTQFHRYLFQGNMQKVFQGFVFTSHICIVCSMLAGLFWVIQHITSGVGVVWFILAIEILLGYVIYQGVSCSYKVIAYITPFLLCMFVLVTSLSIRQGLYNVSLQSVSPVMCVYAIIAGFLYAGMNLQTTSSVIMYVGSRFTAKRNWKVSLFVSTCLFIFLCMGTVALWGIPTEMQTSAMPFYELAQSRGVVFTVFYLIALFLGIVTTLISSAQTATDILTVSCKHNKGLAVCLVLGGSTLFASLGFQKVISFLYPFMGVLGLVYIFMVCMAVKKYVSHM